jgi:hypothetical protein
MQQRSVATAEGSTAGATPTQNPKSTSNNVADDDAKPALDTPAGRLKACAKNCGGPLSLEDWWAIKAEAELRGVGLAELADLAEKDNGHWRSSSAALRWLVKKYSQKAAEVPAEKPAEVRKSKCKRCRADNGRGAVLDGTRVIPCPDCSTPEWVDKLSRDEAERSERGTAKQAGVPA